MKDENNLKLFEKYEKIILLKFKHNKKFTEKFINYMYLDLSKIGLSLKFLKKQYFLFLKIKEVA